jgi:hypothetical protein
MIQRGDHRKYPETIYKIDRTNVFNKRINRYLPYSQMISVRPVDNDKKCERELIKEFKSEFEFINNIGNEFFEGDERVRYLFLIIMSQRIYLR